MLNQLNGLYLHGDSTLTLIDPQFKATFSYIISYIYDISDTFNEYFPVFMMGNSVQSLLASRVSYERSMMTSMSYNLNKNLPLRLVKDPQQTYIFDELETDEQV